jgi:hypothetical protein
MAQGGGTIVAKVLLVEDDPVNRLVVRAMIAGRGLHCEAANSGTEALDLLTRQPFDAVLMDWQMPDMDGLEVTRLLRSGACGALNRANSADGQCFCRGPRYLPGCRHERLPLQAGAGRDPAPLRAAVVPQREPAD